MTKALYKNGDNDYRCHSDLYYFQEMALQTLEKSCRKDQKYLGRYPLRSGFFPKLASLIPPFTAYIVLTFITWEYKYVLRRLVDIWLIIVTLFIITSLLNAINKIYESYPVSKNRPITFFIQLIKVFLYTVVVITVVSVLVNKSPEHLIVGLSAFAAVLLLIFRIRSWDSLPESS